MRVWEVLPNDDWPAGVSDGLRLPCSSCGRRTMFDYQVDDRFWREVVPDNMHRSVVCLPCLDAMAVREGRSLGEHLLEIQFTGTDETTIFVAAVCWKYGLRSGEGSRR